MGVKLVCVVCGRKFSAGQGVTITVGERSYSFHSKGCALKFLRKVLEGIEQSEVSKAMERVADEYTEILKGRAEKTAKKIA
ncbi:MAG: hypothetical protein QXP80_04220 [Zestosphaera sp.]